MPEEVTRRVDADASQGKGSGRYTSVPSTRSVDLLRQRLPRFNAFEFLDRWNRYEVLGELGRGAMGTVFRAFDLQLRREVALKCLNTDAELTDQNVERFLDEIQLHARLTHPAIAPLYDFGLSPEGHLFMSMDLIVAKSFEQTIATYHQQPGNSDLHLADLLESFARICDAISFAHGLGIVHRDLKPENILCGAFGEIFVMDWGLATTYQKATEQAPLALPAMSADDRSFAHRAVTRKLQKRMEKEDFRAVDQGIPAVRLAHRSMLGNVVGTIGYMSPEQAMGRSDLVSPQSDSYSLGSILYDILCGTPPISHDGKEENIAKVLDAIIDGRVVPPDQRGARCNVPAELAAIAMKAISREPRDRYQDVSELKRAVQDWSRRAAIASTTLAGVQATLDDAELQLRGGQAEAARLMLGASLGKLEGIEGADRLRTSVQRVIQEAEASIALRDERDAAVRQYRELRETIVESQFGIVMSQLRLPAPTIRRAHDRLLAALKTSGLWHSPDAVLKRFERHLAHAQHTLGGDVSPREDIILAMFLFSWVCIRMANVSSQENGKDQFMVEAEAALRQLDHLAGHYRSTKLMLARHARIAGRTAEMLRLEEAATSMDVQGPDDEIFLAAIHFFDYRLPSALDHLKRALLQDPGSFWGHALLIFVHSGLGNVEGAFAELSTCLALQPSRSMLWTIRGFLLRELGRFEEAHEALDRALTFGPNDSLARLIRSDLRLRLGRIDWQRDLDSAADMVTPPVSTWDYFVLALVALYKNDTEYAFEFVQAALKRSPDMPQLYGLESSIYMRSQNFDLAEKMLDKAFKLAPADPRLTESMYSLLIRQKRYAEVCQRFLDDERNRPEAATPNACLLAARAFAGYAGPEDTGDEERADTNHALILLRKAAQSRAISRQEVDDAVEFNHLRGTPEFKEAYRMLRDGPPAPRIFQPSIES